MLGVIRECRVVKKNKKLKQNWANAILEEVQSFLSRAKQGNYIVKKVFPHEVTLMLDPEMQVGAS